MARHRSVQCDLYSHLLKGCSIRSGNGKDISRLAIDRFELHLGRASGVRLVPSSVHALSAVRRRDPIYLLPPEPALLVNRSPELETLRQSLIPRHVVDVHGPDGAGKSTLASALAHDFDLNRFPDGAVYVNGPFFDQDLLQALFDSFYASDTPVKITSAHTHTYLNNLRALIVLDEVGLGPQQIDPVLDAVSESAVLVTGSERTALGRGRSVKLPGLPRQAAVELFNKTASPPPSPEDAPFVDQICLLLNDMPLSVAGVAAQTAFEGKSLIHVLTDLQSRRPWAGPGGDPSIGPALEQIVLILDETDRRLLTLIAAFSGPGASSGALTSMICLSNNEFQERISRLEQLRLIQTIESPQRTSFARSRGAIPRRVALVSAFAETVRTWLVDDEARKMVAKYYATRLNRGDQLPGEDLRGVLVAIEDCWQNGWLDYLQPLVRATDRILAELRWWDEWQHVLDLARRSAQSLSDRALEAWAVHQLGSMLGVLGELDRSCHLLRTARGIREALNDTEGANLTDQNLAIIEGLLPAVVVEDELHESELEAIEETLEEPPPELQREQPEVVAAAADERPRRPKLWAIAVAAVIVLAVAVAATAYIAGFGQRQASTPGLPVSWEFGDAWNALDNQTWTQQIKIIVSDETVKLNFFADDRPVAEEFEVVLPLCEGAEGTIRVESDDGQVGSIPYAFETPFCP